MKKFIIGFSILLATLVTGILAFISFEQPIDTFVSPNGRYKVQLYGDKTRPWFFANTVTAKMFSNGERIASDRIHYGGGFDTSFDMKYQKYVWTDNNILSFRGFQNRIVANKENGDSLFINNNTDKKIRYLKIGFSVNLFLVFGLESHSSQTIYVNHSTAPEYIYATGEFEDGNKIKFESVNFSEKSKKQINELFQYCALVENDKSSITSKQIEGYKTSPKVIISKTESCPQ